MQKQIGVEVISVKIEAIRILSVPHKLEKIYCKSHDTVQYIHQYTEIKTIYH